MAQIAAALADDAGLQLRQFAQQDRHETVQEVLRVVGWNAEADLAGKLAPVERGQGRVVEAQQLLGVTEQGFTSVGEPDSLVAALQQPQAELLLEPLELHADRSLGAKHGDGGLLQPAFPDDDAECAQQFEIEQGIHAASGFVRNGPEGNARLRGTG